MFRTPQGKVIPGRVTACGQLVFVDLDIDSGTVIVDDSARDGRTETFVIRSELPAATRRAEVAIFGRRSRLPRYPFFVLAFALLGVVWLVTRDARLVQHANRSRH